MTTQIIVGDMMERLRDLADNSVDSVVCDPPYHLTSIVKRFGAQDAAPAKAGKTGAFARTSKGFMGQTWDGGDIAFRPETWAEVLRVLKPGGHLVAFSGTRTYHRMTVAIEDAGFEVRDMIAWTYGSGFPKSHDVAKGITARAKHGGSSPKNLRQARQGEDYAPTGQEDYRKGRAFSDEIESDNRPTELTPEAQAWQGWGTALKPSLEPICLARKPLSEKSVAANVLKHGTGALNIDATRIQTGDDLNGGRYSDNKLGDDGSTYGSGINKRSANDYEQPQGRWPANLCHDGSDEVLAGFPETTSGSRNGEYSSDANVFGKYGNKTAPLEGDSGSAARFFYCAKAGKLDRLGSTHPTVKPVALMRWLVRMVTPPNGTVLDPFAGTGSTAIAAFVEGFDSIMVELRQEAADDIQRRVDFVSGLGRTKLDELANGHDEEKRSKAGGAGLPLFGE